MSIKISGILPGPTGEPAAHIGITLRAVKTSLTVITTLESNSITGEDGSYSLNAEPGKYNVLLWVDGINARNVGTINVYSDSLPGTLNNFLTAQREEDVTPEIILQLEQLRTEALQAALEAKESKDEATHQASIATNAAENAAHETADLITAVVKDDADRAESAREGAETAKLAVDTMVAEVAQHHTEVGQLASVASNSAAAAAGSSNSATQSASESESSKNAAAQSAQAAASSAGSAGSSAAAVADDKAAAEGFRDEAEEFAMQAKASAESIDVSALEEQINQKVSQTVFDEAIGGKASTQQLADGLANKLTVQSTLLSTDLNLAVTSGIYHPTVAALNLPLQVLGVMEVYLRQDGTSLVQIFHTTVMTLGNTNRHFVRIGTLSAGIWSFTVWAEQYTSLTMESLGIGLPYQPDMHNFDWQNFSFTSGANYVTRYDTWVNPPEGVTYDAGARVSIRVVYISTVNGPRMGLKLTPDTGAAANFKVYNLLCVGASGSRVFTFWQDWNSANPVPVSGGGTGAITAPLARTALGLGSAAVVDVVANSADQTAGRAMTTGSNGIGGQSLNMTSVGNAWLNPLGMMSFTTATNWGGTTPTDGTGSLPAHWNVISIGVGTGQVAAASRKAVIAIQSYNVGSGAPQCYVRTIHDTALSPAVMLYHTNNTTVDSNGFLKKASPVVKLYGDGSSETNYESEGAISERISEGVYKISGVLGFNSDDSWGGVDGGIEIPIDKNKQPLIWVDYEIDEGGDLIIKTYHRTHPASPEFAQNNINGYENGQPIDIPVGRFIDLRIQMPGADVDDIIENTIN